MDNSLLHWLNIGLSNLTSVEAALKPKNKGNITCPIPHHHSFHLDLSASGFWVVVSSSPADLHRREQTIVAAEG